jgi:hypothetical protein
MEIATKNSEVAEAIERSKALRKEILNTLKIDNIEYELDQWLTIKNYCDKFNISDTHIVTNWIRRGVVPAENVMVVEELNGLRLIKAVAYM